MAEVKLSEIHALQVENRRLREALAPFAALGALLTHDHPDDPIYGVGRADGFAEVSAGDFQRAAKALGPISMEEE